MAKADPKPLPADTSKDCATGWCDKENGQFCAPKGWGGQGKESGNPKLGSRQ
jgi:hypothetical protein